MGGPKKDTIREGHDFSRAANRSESLALQRLRLAVPSELSEKAPEAYRSGFKAGRDINGLLARLKSCPSRTLPQTEGQIV
jgi:hypothetical protein